MLLAAAAAFYVLAAWQSAPGFYDGFAPPGDTYRWVKVPDGVTGNGLAPLPGMVVLAVSTDRTRVAAGSAATGESPPQAQLTIRAGALSPPATDPLEVDVEPFAAPDPPAGAVMVGNLYCLGAPAEMAKGGQIVLSLRYSDALPSANAVFRYDQASRVWTRLPAFHDGKRAVVTATITTLGCFAPARIGATPGPSGSVPRSNRALPYVAAAAVLLVLLAGLPLYLRLRRDKRVRSRS
jgi:hypothetical protein